MPPRPAKTTICPTCRKLVSRDETRCPYCGTRKPGSWIHHNPLAGLLDDPDRLIKAIITLNVIMFGLTIVMSFRGVKLSLNPLTFLSPDSRSLLVFGATGKVPIEGMNRWWSLLSANYLHGGILHIVFNMLAFRQIAALIAREYGTSRMFMIYTLGGILGFGVSYLAGTPFTIGSSAAVCSLIGAALYYGKTRGGAYGQAVYRQIGGWALMIFLFGFTIPGIDNWGHGGGIGAGVLLGFLLGYREIRRETSWYRRAAFVCAAGTVAVLAWAAASSVYYLSIVDM